MKLTGVEIPSQSLPKISPNTLLIAVLDQQGETKLIQVDNPSFPEVNTTLKVKANATTEEPQPQSGCYVWNGVKWIWVDPCPN